MRRGLAARHGLLMLLLGLSSPPVVSAGNFPGEQPVYAREVGQNQRFFYVASGDGEGKLQYICRAFPGTIGSDDVNSSIWQVTRFTYDSSHRISTIATAGEDDAYIFSCASRVSLDYD